MNKLIEMLANDYPDSEHRMTVVDFADWLKEKMAGYRMVPVEHLQSALDQVQNAMKEAYNNAYPECCGRPGIECCGSPEPAWEEEDQRIMDALHPVNLSLIAMLKAAPDLGANEHQQEAPR